MPELSNLNTCDQDSSFYPFTFTTTTENYLSTENYTKQKEKVDDHLLIEFHKIYGNKWKQISNHLPNTSDSSIKNMFYTLIRKALRKINVYIELDSRTKGRKPKVFKLNFVFKLANLAESQRITDFQQNFGNIRGFYSKLLYKLLEIKNMEFEQLKNLINAKLLQEEVLNLRKCFDSLIQNLRLIEKIFIEQNLIKKGRTKKKFPKKGLAQRAYSSKIFKESSEDLVAQLFWTLSEINSKQLKTETNIGQESQDSDMVCQVEAPAQHLEQTKDDLDNCLEIKSFDPILFE